jgi:DNA (cytosine-5)-methyltransferase 1
MRYFRLLELYCKAGGSGMGYAAAGFIVSGIDIKPQPNYPFAFSQGDALRLDAQIIAENFDAIHASPPCQFASPLRFAPGGKEHINLIPATRKLLQATGLPYVIENVEDAAEHLINPITLCGTMFGLGSHGAQLQRHRCFEINWPFNSDLACAHDSAKPVLGVYGGHARIRAARFGGRKTRDAWPNGHWPVASEAMGMDWATLAEMSEAVPPAYTKYLGRQLLAHLLQQRVAA